MGQNTDVYFEKFSDEDGLPNNLFKHMLQDQQGILWMAGADGLAKYDGYTFTTFRHSNADSTSISGNALDYIYEDTKGRLWVCTLGYGLDISNETKSCFRPLPVVDSISQRLSFVIVNYIQEDTRGYYWLATNDGLIVLEEKDEIFYQVAPLDTRAYNDLNYPTTFFLDSAGHVWIGTECGLYVYNGSDKSLTTPDMIQGLPASVIHQIRYDRNGRIWVACQNEGPRMYSSAAGYSLFKPLDGIPFRSAGKTLRFTFDLDNRLWIAVFDEQAYGYDFRDSSLFLESSVNSNITLERFLRYPFVDHSGNVWIHAEGYNIHRYPKGFRNYQHPFAFHQSNTAIYGTGAHFWMAYREKGAVQMDHNMNAARHFSTELPQSWIPVDHIQGFLRVRSGNLIIVGFSTITIMDPNNKIIATHQISGSNREIYEDSKGRIWIGGIRGLHLFTEQNGSEKIFRLPPRQGDARNFVQGITEDARGFIWFASDMRGLARLDPVTENVIQFLPVAGDINSLPTAGIVDLACDDRNTLWLATDVALIRFDPVTFKIKSYNRSHGLQSDFITAVLCDRSGKIWVSTNTGISVFDPATESFTNYSRKDGLLNNSYYRRSKFLADDGTIFFGGTQGVDYFHPDHLRKNPTAPRMYLSGILVNNKECSISDLYSGDESFHLSYADNMLDITFAGLHYAGQNHVRHFYRIDGLHDEWLDLGNKRQVLFSGLRPGDYVFRAKAITSDGVWSEEELRFPIFVSPPFYEALGFRILAICLLAAGFFGIVRYRERRIQMKDKKEAEVAQQIRDLETRALQAQMNPHFIYNCMNSIQQFMILHDYEGAMKYLTRFSRLLRMVLNTSAQKRVALSDELKLIEDYVELENMRFPDKFSYTIDVSPDLNVHTIEIPPFLIQPQIENAIRHGLMRKPSPGHLTIRIDKQNQHMIVVVEDNGIGRASAKSAAQHPVHESKGMSILEERLAHLHPENGRHPLNIIDLYHPDGSPAGTRVEIILPID